MTAVDAKTAVLADKLQQVQCRCDPTALKAVVTDVYGLFAAQVPSPGLPSGSQEQDMMDTLHAPGLLHRLQLREIVSRHFPLFQREKVIVACIDLGSTLTLDDCMTAMREGRLEQAPRVPTATARTVTP